jgi:hypothetical protein
MKNESPATAGLAISGCSLSRLTASSSNFRPGLMTVQTALSLKAMTIHGAILMGLVLSVERRGLQPQPGFVVTSVANLVDKSRDKQMRVGKQQIGK